MKNVKKVRLKILEHKHSINLAFYNHRFNHFDANYIHDQITSFRSPKARNFFSSLLLLSSFILS